jgi:Fe-S-cluster containining protein
MGNPRSGTQVSEKKIPPKKMYDQGLYFSCRRCSACCRYESGYVFLSGADAALLAETLKMGYTEFMETFCRWIPFPGGTERLSLQETPDYDCVFWGFFPGRAKGEGCGVYDARPLQCRAFPFWHSALHSGGAWRRLARDCPGMDSGSFHSEGEIEGWLEAQEAAPAVARAAPGPGGEK